MFIDWIDWMTFCKHYRYNILAVFTFCEFWLLGRSISLVFLSVFLYESRVIMLGCNRSLVLFERIRVTISFFEWIPYFWRFYLMMFMFYFIFYFSRSRFYATSFYIIWFFTFYSSILVSIYSIFNANLLRNSRNRSSCTVNS